MNRKTPLALNPPVIGRMEAAIQGMNKFFTGVQCKHGHISQRYVTTGACLSCLRPAIRRVETGYLPNAWRPDIWMRRPMSPHEVQELRRLLQHWVETTVASWDKDPLPIPAPVQSVKVEYQHPEGGWTLARQRAQLESAEARKRFEGGWTEPSHHIPKLPGS